MACLGLGLGMIISAMTNKYRDLAFLVTFGTQLLMYATPIIYPLSSVSNTYRWLINLNPMTEIVEISRLAFLGKGEFSFTSFSYSIIITFVALIIGTLIFNKVEKTFIDKV
jgi:lipopolysaccharide transport system permease protein